MLGWMILIGLVCLVIGAVVGFYAGAWSVSRALTAKAEQKLTPESQLAFGALLLKILED